MSGPGFLAFSPVCWSTAISHFGRIVREFSCFSDLALKLASSEFK